MQEFNQRKIKSILSCKKESRGQLVLTVRLVVLLLAWLLLNDWLRAGCTPVARLRLFRGADVLVLLLWRFCE